MLFVYIDVIITNVRFIAGGSLFIRKELHMVTKEIVITKEYGADIIPYLVQSACHYDSTLHITDGSKNINMKSIMGMTILHLKKGSTFKLVAEGSDEAKAIDEIAVCFE